MAGRVDWNDGHFKDRLSKQLFNGLTSAAGKVQHDAQASMKGGGSPHRPSAPGSPPNVDTGALRGSGQTNVFTDGTRIRAQVAFGGGNVPYGKLHEFGGRNHPPRPYLRPALEQNRGNIMRHLT